MLIYVIALILVVAFFFCTILYRKKFRKKLSRKKHPLKFMYGMSMFLLDRIPKRYINKNSKSSKAMRLLNAKEDIKKEHYLYLVQKISVCMIIMIMTILVGMVMCFTENQSSKSITKLARDAKNTQTYYFLAKTENGEEESIIVEVKKKEMTEEEIYKSLSRAGPEIEKKVLGENKNPDHITKPLQLITKYGKENIGVIWKISNSDVIGYDGTISNKVSAEGELVELTAIMQLENTVEEHTFSVMVFPPSNNWSMQEQIQEHVNTTDLFEEEVSLPESVGGKKVRYYEKQEHTSVWVTVAGIIIAIAMFFIKDRDLKKDIEKRNRQVMNDYSEIVSKILLYYGAGMSMKSTFERIVNDYRKDKQEDKDQLRYAYEEMEIALIKMKSGVSEMKAISEYGSRCGLHCYIKLAGLIEQNIKRGAQELTYALKVEVQSAMNERRSNALKIGGEISTKLLGPMIIMLIISMAIIMVPAFMSINL